MANADELQLAVVEEVSYGVNPAGEFDVLRFTKESFRQETQSVSSREIRADRQVPDVTRINISGAGGFEWEFSYGTFDNIFKAMMFSSGWSAVVTHSATDIAGATGSGQYTLTRVAGSWVTDGFVVGQWVRVAGWTTTGVANNGYGKISAVTTTVLTVQLNGNGATKVAGDTVEVEQGAQIVNGVSLTSMFFEKEWTDLSNEFAGHAGCVGNSWNMEVSPDGIITGAFDFMGKSEASSAVQLATSYDSATPTTTQVMNAIDHVTAVIEARGSGAAEIDLTNISFALNNNLRARRVIATLGAVSIGSGKVAVTGSFDGYFEDKAIIDKYLNQTVTGLALKFLDADGNAYVMDFPQVKLTSGTRNATGENTDVMQPVNFTAYRHPTENVTIRMVRWAV